MEESIAIYLRDQAVGERPSKALERIADFLEGIKEYWILCFGPGARLEYLDKNQQANLSYEDRNKIERDLQDLNPW